MSARDPETTAPGQAAETLGQTAGTPEQAAGTPEQTAGTPEQTAGTPEQAAGTLGQTAGTPEQAAGTPGLEPFRRRLDALDEQIARLLGERFGICREIALYKRAHEIPMMQPQRVAEVRARYLARGAEVDLPSDFTADLFELLIGATCKLEDELIETSAATREEGLR